LALYPDDKSSELDEMKKRWPKKFWPEIAIFGEIHPGDRIFVGTGCGEPQHLVGALKSYVEKRLNSLFGAEMIHVWTLGIAPCAEEKFRENFRLNSFFVGSRSRGAINRGDADYTPIFLSEVPALFRKGAIPILAYEDPVSGEMDEESDIDILIEFDGRRSLLDLAHLKNELEDATNRRVDVLTYKSLHPRLKDRIQAEQVPISGLIEDHSERTEAVLEDLPFIA
jgi:hypothetical protein